MLRSAFNSYGKDLWATQDMDQNFFFKFIKQVKINNYFLISLPTNHVDHFTKEFK